MQLSLNHKSRGEASLSTCPGPSLSPPLLPCPPRQIRPPATSAPAAPIPGGVGLLGSSAPARRQQVTFPSSICDFKIEMSQSKEVRYTARSITPPANRDGTSKSPPPKRRSISRSPPPKRSASRSPRPRSPRRHSTSRSPRPRRRGRSRSRDRSRSRSGDDLRNPGNNLYVTGLSTRVTEADLEKFFSKEGKVQSCHVVLDPRTKESRGFAFVTMDSVDDARRCIKYLHRTVLEGRLVSVEKAKRTRERTPTPGKYCGRRGGSQRRSRSPSPYRSRRRERSRSRDHRRERSRRRDRSRSRDRRGSSPHERDSYRRRGDRSRSPTSNGNHRKD